MLYRAPQEETGKELRVRAEYTDRRGTGKEATSPETQPVTADPIANAPPRFTGGNAFSIAEGEAGRNVGAPLSTSDRDSDRVTFAMGTGEESDFFEINASTGQLRLVKAVDFEDLPAHGFYLATVTIHDGKGVDADNMVITETTEDATASVTVNIIDVEEVGVVTLSAEEPETGTALDATLADGDGNVSEETWQWARSANGRTNWFNIDGATASTYTPNEDDEDFYLRARVEYTDNRGSGKSAEGITDGPVPSLNRRPAFPDSEDGERSVDENTRAGANIGAPVAAVDPESNTLTYTLTGTDADAFTIVTRTGQIKVKDALDFETKESYRVTVNVHDGRDGAGATDTTVDNSQDVTITVQNVDEPGVVTLTTLTGVIQARVEVTAALSDDDGSVSGVAWQWSQSPNGRTDWANISGETGTTYTPTDDFERRFIRATASYTDGHGASKTARGVSPRVAKAPPVNSPPAFPSTEDGRREVAEDATGGASIGAPVAATDLNAGESAVNDPLAYSLTGTDAASFEIDAGTGQISLASGVTLDYEGKRSYRVTVEVTDGHDELGDDDMGEIDARRNVTIDVTDVNEAPAVTGDGAVSVEENINRAIATYTGTDPERDTLTWSVSGNDFWISDRGQLYFRTPPSFEQGATYTVTVTATDDDAATPLSGSFDVTVTVTDVEEEGVVTLTPPRGWVDAQTRFSADLTDDDGDITATIWRWARSPNGRSSWTDIAGATSNSYTAGADDLNQYLRVTAFYEDRRSSDKMAEAVLSTPVGDVRPAANTASEFTDTGPVTRTVREGTAAGRNVGAPVRATDADRGEVLTYSLSGTDADAFDIDAATGQLRTKEVLDHGAKDSYTVTVEVHDGFDPTYTTHSTASDATIDVTITVTAAPVVRPPPPPPPPPAPVVGGVVPLPTNRSPSFSEGDETSRSVAENTAAGQDIGAPLEAVDPDRGDTLTYTLEGEDAGSFDIDAATGQLRTKAAPDYETRTSYTVIVRVEDRQGSGDAIEVTVTVTNVGLSGIAGQYDLDDNETIDRDEAIAAVADYFRDAISKEETLAIIQLYFAG